MWNKLAFIFVTVITSSITIPSVHIFMYFFTIFCSPFVGTFYDIIFFGESIDNISELFANNYINVSLGRLTVEDRALWISLYKVVSSITSVIVGLLFSIQFVMWLFSF